jgi:hypothetical protein
MHYDLHFSFFIVYFDQVEQNPILQDQIKQNITLVPIGQLLAYEGYFGLDRKSKHNT